MDILALSRRIPLLGFFGSSASDDDFADRLNYKYTVAILVVFAFIVTNKHFGHNQINCWVPALFSKNFEEYTNLVCWITNTYYIPFDKQIPTTEAERRSSELRYYQWVAYILLILALLFYLPRIIWRTLSLRSGIDIKDVIEASQDFKSVSKLEKNRKMMEYMIGTIDQYVDDPRRQRSNRHMNFLRRTIALSCFMFGKFLGNYLVILYLFVKVLYIVNCVGQLFLISILLGRNFYIYGASIFRDIIQGKGYADSEYFPRVTMCKFQVRELGLKNFSHEYNVQCVLPINLFNQQIFTFLWFWYLILLIINTSALLIWVYRFIPVNQYNYAIRRIKMLRIRLMESSKVNHKKTNTPLHQTTLHRRSTTSRRTMRIHEIVEYENQQSMRSSFKENKPNEYEQPRMFPNIPPNYNFNLVTIGNSTSSGVRMRRNITCSSDGAGGAQTDSSATASDYFEFESYLTASSFSPKNYKAFVHDYLEPDGMFMLRMVGSNSGDFVCTQVLHNLWKLFLCKKCSQNAKPDGSESATPSYNADTAHTSEFDEEEEESPSKRREGEPSSIKSRFLFKKQAQTATKSKMPQPQLKTILTRKKPSLIGRLFTDVTSAASSKGTSPAKLNAPPKSRSIHMMAQQRRAIAKSSQNKPQTRDETFNKEMKRFQSIKRITHPPNRRNRPTESAEPVEE